MMRRYNAIDRKAKRLKKEQNKKLKKEKKHVLYSPG